jgi:hypothetical protein
MILLFMLPAVTGMMGMHHYAHLFSTEMGSSNLFCLGQHGTVILILALKVARITGVSHQHPACIFVFEIGSH